MTDAEKIQVAADMIRTEMAVRGSVVSEADSLAVARRLHGIWFDRVRLNGVGERYHEENTGRNRNGRE